MAEVGADVRMGRGLHPAVRDAGLPRPRLHLDTVLGGGPDAPTLLWTNAIATGMPIPEKRGITTAQRLTTATEAVDDVIIVALFIHPCLVPQLPVIPTDRAGPQWIAAVGASIPLPLRWAHRGATGTAEQQR